MLGKVCNFIFLSFLQIRAGGLQRVVVADPGSREERPEILSADTRANSAAIVQQYGGVGLRSKGNDY